MPLTVDRKVMASVMDTHRFEGIRYEFVPGREVIPYLAPHESRRLFGGAEGPVHSHTHESYAAVEAETGRVYGRPPVRAHTHSETDAHIHKAPARDRFATRPWGMMVSGRQNSAALLARMLQFGDSMFPIGGFSFSCGLESAMQKGVVTDAATSPRVRAHRGGAGRARRRHRADRCASRGTAGDVDALIRIDEQVYARKLSDEVRTMSVRMGKKFTEMGVQVIGAPLLCTWRECIETSVTPGCYPVALGDQFRRAGSAGARSVRRAPVRSSRRRFSVPPCG